MRKNKDDRRCGGAGNCREGLLDDPPAEKRPATDEVRRPENRKALQQGVKIRLGLKDEKITAST